MIRLFHKNLLKKKLKLDLKMIMKRLKKTINQLLRMVKITKTKRITIRKKTMINLMKRRLKLRLLCLRSK